MLKPVWIATIDRGARETLLLLLLAALGLAMGGVGALALWWWLR